MHRDEDKSTRDGMPGGTNHPMPTVREGDGPVVSVTEF
jgi:hypothetical protein